MHAKSLIAGLAATVAIAVPVAAQAAAPAATPLQKVSAAVEPSIVYMETTFEAAVKDPKWGFIGGEKNFSVTYTCSGFFVNPDGYFASAGHCVDYDQDVKDDLLAKAAEWSYANEKWSPDTTEEEAVNEALLHWRLRDPQNWRSAGAKRTVRAVYPSGKPLPARVLGFRAFEGGDVALLKLEAKNTPVLSLAPTADLEVGSQIVSVGYPGSVDLVTDQSFDPSFKDGSISSVKTVDDGLRQVFEISGAMSGGMSGGPTVDLQGRVVGVNSFKITDESQPFNFISPASEVQALMQDKGVENKLGKPDELYRAGLAAYNAGNREKALANLEQLLDMVPDHKAGEELRTRAMKLAAAKPAPRNDGGVPVAPIGLGLAALAALAALVIRRRRTTPATTVSEMPAADTAIVQLAVRAGAAARDRRARRPAGPAGRSPHRARPGARHRPRRGGRADRRGRHLPPPRDGRPVGRRPRRHRPRLLERHHGQRGTGAGAGGAAPRRRDRPRRLHHRGRPRRQRPHRRADRHAAAGAGRLGTAADERGPRVASPRGPHSRPSPRFGRRAPRADRGRA